MTATPAPSDEETLAAIIALAEQGRPRWHAQAACRGRLSLFFLEAGDSSDPARRLCAACPVTDLCLAEGERDVEHGIRAGLTPTKRARLRIAAGRGRRPAAA